jgi:serine O-acetyltransferase
VLRSIREDVRAAREKDPAAKSVLEVLLCYPGLHALWAHRVEHFLWRRRLRLLARLLAHGTRALTGVEIHPGARIGRRVFIDHGSGVVIGETAEVGDDVLIYQGVTLGGVSRKDAKRHPTVDDGAILGAHVILLGPIHIGRGARIAPGVVLRESVPAGATVRPRATVLIEEAPLPPGVD